eukprot:308952-Pelagomonas_calceolata.AAC.6
MQNHGVLVNVVCHNAIPLGRSLALPTGKTGNNVNKKTRSLALPTGKTGNNVNKKNTHGEAEPALSNLTSMLTKARHGRPPFQPQVLAWPPIFLNG